MEIRPLTRKEQLEYHIPFLKSQVEELLLLIEQEENELEQINKENLILERRKENEK